MNTALLGHTWRSQRLKLVVVGSGLVLWGFLMPVIYATFGVDFRRLTDSGVIPEQFTQFTEFGGGDLFSVAGAIGLGFVHPIALLLIGVFAVGFAAAAVAGERQRGTLEVILARPVSRRTLYLTLFVATLIFVAAAVGAVLVGAVVGATAFNVIDELPTGNLPVLWLNGTLLFMALGAIGLAASVSFDRLTPALGITLGVTIVSYFLEILGSLWPDAEPLRPYSLFHYLQPREVLNEGMQTFDVGLLLVVIAAAVIYALLAFPRRDIAAPS